MASLPLEARENISATSNGVRNLGSFLAILYSNTLLFSRPDDLKSPGILILGHWRGNR